MCAGGPLESSGRSTSALLVHGEGAGPDVVRERAELNEFRPGLGTESGIEARKQQESTRQQAHLKAVSIEGSQQLPSSKKG